MLESYLLPITVRAVRRLAGSPKMITWTWDTIKGFGQAKALKTSYVFLFLVPTIARVFINMPASIKIPFWDKTLELPLELPFSWVVLFISACLASLGNVIYAVMCPKLVKQFTDFPAFKAAQRDGTFLHSTVRTLALQRSGASTTEQVNALSELYNSTPVDTPQLVSSLDSGTRLAPSGFYFVRDSANLGRPLSRLIASLAYFGAFICLGWIALQNVGYVVRSFWPFSMGG
ncbi:MAG: hypothetical protein IID37_02555 [Planctomycetes bacterium]|nr:hypothetical protein [Planctomycetota bacterium]